MSTTCGCDICGRFQFFAVPFEPTLCPDCNACPKRFNFEMGLLEEQMEKGNITEGEYLEECDDLKFFYDQWVNEIYVCKCPRCYNPLEIHKLKFKSIEAELFSRLVWVNAL
jgi:hypothetical protein